MINETLDSVVGETYIRTTHAGRHDADDDISCVLRSRNAFVLIPEAEVAIKHK